MALGAPTATRDPGARTRATDPHLDIAELDDAALEAMARDDLAIIERAQRGLGEFATATAMRAPATASVAAGNAGVRAAALATRRSPPTVVNNTPSAATAGDLSTPAQIRAELLAIRALLVS